MARIRTIKPEFFTSENIVELSPYGRLLYVALWCEADREGRLSWKPKTFKMRYFPADSIDIEAEAKALLDAELVRKYGDGLAYIPTFLEHQHINPRETQSKLPAPDASGSRRTRVSDAQVGRERKGSKHDASKRDEAFDLFYAAYPKKVGKKQAEQAWSKIPESDYKQVIDALCRHKLSADWKKDGGKYVPNPATWLNGRRWEDEISVAALSSGNAGEWGLL